ncbi:MAG: hypothetical protein QG647_264 [Patescibacteria group bacterium]|nr:hypothetical protein [Patescibacteria group bacterium]
MSQTKSVNEMDVFEKMGYAFSKIDESWEALKFNILTFLGIIAVPMLATIVAIPVFLLPFMASVNDNNGTISVFASIFTFALSIILTIIWLLVTPALVATQLASVRKQKISITEAFELSKHFIVRYVVIGLLIGLAVALPFIVSTLLMIVLIGFILLPLAIVWAIAVWFFTLLAPYILKTKDLSITETLKSSYEVSKQNWQWVLAIVVVYLGIQAASIVPFIGWIASFILMIAYACLPAYIYVNHIALASASSKPADITVTKSQTPATKKVSKPKKTSKN